MITQRKKLRIFLLVFFAIFVAAGIFFCRGQRTIAKADYTTCDDTATHAVNYSASGLTRSYIRYVYASSSSIGSPTNTIGNTAVFREIRSVKIELSSKYDYSFVRNYQLHIFLDSIEAGENKKTFNHGDERVPYDCENVIAIEYNGVTEIPKSFNIDIPDNFIASGQTLKINLRETAYEKYSFNSTPTETHHVTVDVNITVDKLPPSVTLSCGDNGYTNGSVQVDYFDSMSSCWGAYEKATGKDFTLSDQTTFTSGAGFSEEGNYSVQVWDVFNNKTEKKFTIDKTAPTLTLNNLIGADEKAKFNVSENVAKDYVSASWKTDEYGVGKQFSNKDDEITAFYGYSVSGFPTSASTSYRMNQRLTNEGYYRFEIRDKSGNKSVYYAVVDNSPPVVTAPDEYLNSTFSISAKDKFGVGIEYRKGGTGSFTRLYVDSMSVECTEENYGTYQYRAFDLAGNQSKIYTVNLYYRETFGNRESIYNSYSLPYWYTVTLPQRIYHDIYGTYSFRDRSSAIAFAIAKEWEYRVVTVPGGFHYVNYSNESITQLYTDRTSLDAAVQKYAENYVSDKIVFTKSGKLPVSPMDGEGLSKADALTEQNPELPSELAAYSYLPKMFIRPRFAFTRSIQGVEGNRPSVAMKLIHNGVTAVSGSSVTVGYGASVESVLKDANALQQGWYLVTESDTCGNKEEYLVYIDLALPSVECEITDGSGSSETIIIDEAYIEEHKSVMRYVSLDLKGVVDNDKFIFLTIEGRGLDNTYIYGEEELPCLIYENGYYGNYTITAYDRSLNIFSFTVRIAGAEPKLVHTSLESEIKCTFTIELGDSANALTAVKLFKITYEGVYNELQTDDDGTAVGPNSSSYVLRTGGKYAMQFTDIYGRTITTEPLFYMKGLPVGILSGVKAGGLTNRDVSIKYDADNSVILYAWKDGEWERADELHSVVTDEQNGVASITASAETSYKFKYFLYVLADMNLFTEYYFEIDKIPPTAEIKTTDGETIPQDSVTRKDFFVTWAESGYTVRYYNKKNALGEFGAERYSGETITVAGTYVFVLTDQAKNTLNFSVTLDNAVSWSLDSTEYSRLSDGSYISKYNFTLTVDERTSLWEVTSSNDFSPLNGQKIVIDGTYVFHIADLYGNELFLTLIIDNLPPVPVITAEDGTLLSDNTKTNKKFRVSCEEENVAIAFSFGGGAYAPYDGSFVDQEGIYTFRLSDRMNNRTIITVEIERSVKFTINGSYVQKDGNYYSRTWLSLTAHETFVTFEVTDESGKLRDPFARIDAEGKYFVCIEDAAGNHVEFEIVIDKTAPNVLIKNIKGEELEEGTTVNLPFSVLSEEKDVSITYKRGNTGNTMIYEGELLEGAGRYTFTVSDFLGNKREFEMRITYDVNFDISGNYIEDGFGNYLSKSSITLTAREECVIFRIEHESLDLTYGSGDKVATEGTYNVTILSAHGNKANFQIIIDRTPPVITLEGVDPKGATREDVKIIVSEGDSAYYRINGAKENYQFVGSCVVEEEGAYTVTAKDAVGNSTSVTFTIDKSVSVKTSIPLLENQILTEALSFTFGEPVTATLVKNGESMQYTRGTISDEGVYALEITDDVGNVSRYSWTLLKKRAREYDFTFDDTLYAVSVTKDGDFAAVVQGDRIEMTEKGNYELLFEGTGGTFSLALTVDNTVPTVTITQERKSVLIGGVQKEGVTYKLYKDGKQVDFRQTITAVGNYRLVVEDEIGNMNEYDFSLHYLNAASIALIVIAVVLVVVFLGVLILLRVRQKIK